VTGTITLLSGSTQLHSGQGSLGLLFECAPDAAVHRMYPGTLALDELIGDREQIKTKAAALARTLLEAEPEHRGIRQLSVFEELVIRELQYLLHVKHLHDSLIARGFTSCVFPQAHRFAGLLTMYAAAQGSALTVQSVVATETRGISSLQRSWQRLCKSRFSKPALGNEWEQVMTRLDPWQRRKRWLPQPRVQQQGVWFYSTAWTFTRIGLLYEPFFPQPFNYLIDNPHTGGLPLAAQGRPFIAPACFGRHDMEPSARELHMVRTALRSHLQRVPLDEDEAVVRDAYLASEAFATFMDRLLPAGLFQTSLFERFIRIARPAALVTGNPVFETYALVAARKAGIPTFLLQHGILGDFCQFVDPPVDHYIVRGNFWAAFLAKSARQRALILNPPESVPVASSGIALRRSVLFLTTPYMLQELLDDSDLEDIIAVLLKLCAEQQAELIIRVHPLEAVGTYQNVVSKFATGTGDKVQVTYSQGAGMETLLQRAAVAVTYASTAFLDCLRHQVPIVSFDWHDFSYKRQIGEAGVFHFSQDLVHLGTLTRQALQQQLPAYPGTTQDFLAPTAPADLRQQLHALIRQDAGA